MLHLSSPTIPGLEVMMRKERRHDLLMKEKASACGWMCQFETNTVYQSNLSLCGTDMKQTNLR